VRIALDAMGGDHAPAATVAGAIEAAEDGLHVLLVGDEALIREEARAIGGLPPTVHVHASTDVVEMEDAPRDALRRRRDSSLRVAFELAHGGQADGVVTMGNSGAALAMGMFVCKRLHGVQRPAIAALLPGRAGTVVMLDVGANVDCRPEHLLQFGLMGAALARAAYGKERPVVAVLSNGEEEGKGTDLTRAAAGLLQSAPGIEFRGNVEPKEILDGHADVVVTDGWTGNILLKTAEAMISRVGTVLREAAHSTLAARAGALLMKPALKKALGRFDYAETGGGLLLGIDGCAVIGHGRSEARAVASAIRFASRLVDSGLQRRLAESIEPPPARPVSAPGSAAAPRTDPAPGPTSPASAAR
jgi:glycerol-3-phosphate acyltransferase PlsX